MEKIRQHSFKDETYQIGIDFELIWEWLKRYKLDKFISEVTSEKPRAVCYIDDKAFRFSTWGRSLRELRDHRIL